MEPGYEQRLRPLGRPGSRRLPIIVGIVAAALTIAIAKPWAGPETVPAHSAVGPSPARPIASPRVVISAVADPVWPAVTVASGPPDLAFGEAEAALESLAVRSGTWGVGVTGIGPRLVRDEPWSDWAQIEPESVNSWPAHIAIWPGTGLCTGLPTIYDHPTIVSITMPVDLGSPPRLAGWWTDGSRAASIDDSVRLLTSVDDAGIASVERVDRAKWPVGRYEFHVETGGRIVALTVCLTRRT